MSAPAGSKAYFLNVDLEIHSVRKLDAVAKEMGKRIMILYSGPDIRPKRNSLILEVAGQHKNPDATIHALCDLIEKLSPAGRRLWKSARKEMNVGYALRPSERHSQFSLRTDTLERIVSVGATLGVTYYRDETLQDFENKI